MERTIKVLDHGFVHLRDSMPVADEHAEESGLGAGDYRVEEAARVSTSHLPTIVLDEIGIERDVEYRTPEQTKKLLTFMFKHGHTTPFEQVRFTFIVKLPIFVERQMIRHRTASTNEESARYGKLACEFYVPALDRMQVQSSVNKQGSAEVMPEAQARKLAQVIKDHSELSYALYEGMLSGSIHEGAIAPGLTRELARSVLPVNFYTKKYWTTDLHNLMHFLSKRCAPDAQYEIRVYANAMLEMAALVAPFSISLFREKYGFGASDG